MSGGGVGGRGGGMAGEGELLCGGEGEGGGWMALSVSGSESL